MVILFTLFFTFFIFPEFWHLLYQYREKYGCFVHFHFPKTFLLSSMYTLFFLFSSVASIWLFFLLSSLIYMFFRFSPAPPYLFRFIFHLLSPLHGACLQYHGSKPPLFSLLPHVYVFCFTPQLPFYCMSFFRLAFCTAISLTISRNPPMAYIKTLFLSYFLQNSTFFIIYKTQLLFNFLFAPSSAAKLMPSTISSLHNTLPPL